MVQALDTDATILTVSGVGRDVEVADGAVLPPRDGLRHALEDEARVRAT